MNNKIEINAEDLPLFREKLMKCKLIVLNNMGKHPLTNPKYFNTKDKNTLLKGINDLFDTKTFEEITILFNEVCNETLFNNDADYSTYATYIDHRFPEQQKKIDDEEPELIKLKEEIKKKE